MRLKSILSGRGVTAVLGGCLFAILAGSFDPVVAQAPLAHTVVAAYAAKSAVAALSILLPAARLSRTTDSIWRVPAGAAAARATLRPNSATPSAGRSTTAIQPKSMDPNRA